MKIEVANWPGHFFSIDDDDFNIIMSHGKSWFCSSRGYMQRTSDITGSTVMLHRIIMSYNGKDTIDHIDGDKTNNHKINLRICSLSRNVIYLRERYKLPESGFRNVKTSKNKKRFYAQLRVSKTKLLTSKGFNTAFQAAVEAQNLFEIYRPDMEVNIVWQR